MTHPEFLQAIMGEHERDLDRRARTAALARPAAGPAAAADEPVVLRLCRVHDDAVLEHLAVLEGRPAPTGRFVVAEVAGTIVAALPLAGGPPLADPFRPTAHLLPLLRLRAGQLAGERPRRAPFRLRVAARGWSRA